VKLMLTTTQGSRQLLKAIGHVDGLVTSDEESGKLSLDREDWRLRSSMIVKENICSDIDSYSRVL
jgi:hypothetical protein